MKMFCVALGALVMAGTTFAADNLLGVYVGKVEQVKNARLQQGEPCTVTVTSLEKLRALKFQINGAEAISADEKMLDSEMQAGLEVKVTNKIKGTGVEILSFEHENGTLRRVKTLHRHLGMETIVACGSLARKED